MQTYLRNKLVRGFLNLDLFWINLKNTTAVFMMPNIFDGNLMTIESFEQFTHVSNPYIINEGFERYPSASLLECWL